MVAEHTRASGPGDGLGPDPPPQLPARGSQQPRPTVPGIYLGPEQPQPRARQIPGPNYQDLIPDPRTAQIDPWADPPCPAITWGSRADQGGRAAADTAEHGSCARNLHQGLLGRGSAAEGERAHPDPAQEGGDHGRGQDEGGDAAAGAAAAA